VRRPARLDRRGAAGAGRGRRAARLVLVHERGQHGEGRAGLRHDCDGHGGAHAVLALLHLQVVQQRHQHVLRARARARVRRRRTAAAAARSCSCRPAAPPGPCMRRHRTPTPPRTHASGCVFALGINSHVIGTQPRIQGAGRDGACDRQLRLSQFKTGWPSAARPPADAHLLRKQKRNEAAAADNLAARQSRARRGGEGGEARAPAGRWPWRCSQRC